MINVRTSFTQITSSYLTWKPLKEKAPPEWNMTPECLKHLFYHIPGKKLSPFTIQSSQTSSSNLGFGITSFKCNESLCLYMTLSIVEQDEGIKSSLAGRTMNSICLWCLFIFRSFKIEELFQFPLQSFKGGSAERILVPAFKHDFIQCRRASRWSRHSVSMFHLM